MRGGFEQALIRRKIARARGVSLESLDAAWEKAVAQAGRDVAAEKHGMGLVVRTVGLLRATAKITLTNLAYNMRRLAWIQGRPVSV